MIVPKFRAWITKYGLNKDVFVVDASENPHTSDIIDTDIGRYWGEGSAWHRTRDGAARFIEFLRRTEIQSYQHRIKEIENLVVEVPE